MTESTMWWRDGWTGLTTCDPPLPVAIMRDIIHNVHMAPEMFESINKYFLMNFSITFFFGEVKKKDDRDFVLSKTWCRGGCCLTRVIWCRFGQQLLLDSIPFWHDPACGWNNFNCDKFVIYDDRHMRPFQTFQLLPMPKTSFIPTQTPSDQKQYA